MNLGDFKHITVELRRLKTYHLTCLCVSMYPTNLFLFVLSPYIPHRHYALSTFIYY